MTLSLLNIHAGKCINYLVLTTAFLKVLDHSDPFSHNGIGWWCSGVGISKNKLDSSFVSINIIPID